jgi:CDP-paratose 2-epimerase
MKLLITGGCGFLGSNLAADSIEQGHELAVFDNLSRNGSTKNLEWLRSVGNFQFVLGDVRAKNEVESLILGFKPDVVFHLAGQVAMTTSIQDPLLDFNVNVVGTLNLLESVRSYCPEATVIYSSTNKVYGDLEHFEYQEQDTRYRCDSYPNGFDEKVQLDFHSPYGCSKGAADQYVLDYARIFGLNTIVFRHSSMYGGRQFATIDQGWVGWFCKKAVDASLGKVGAFTITGTGKQVRDVLHCDDMKRLYAAAIKHVEKARGHAFNIGGGHENSLSILELLSNLETLVGQNLQYSKINQRISDQRVFIANLSKAKLLLDWTPQISVNDGLRAAIEWTKQLVAEQG